MEYKVFESSEGNVWKYVFTKEDMVAEAVLYRYEDFYKRTVICCSTQSGCPVGCKFCGTGNKFIRNLTAQEITDQIFKVLRDKNLIETTNKMERLQIMFMSMGEPMLNWKNVQYAIEVLHDVFPNAELLLSTIAPKSEHYGELIALSKKIDKIGLQFSIHRTTEAQRNELIPYKNKMTIREIRDFGLLWWKETGRHPYLNYCVDGTNDSLQDVVVLKDLFSPVVFNFTFSVVCSKDETMKDAGFRELDTVRVFEHQFLGDGYNTRIFDPAGQDDIGGGCGQLWYVQQWMKEHGKKEE
jgi:23S rRNA (adenine2503-C2)-methyltransferase